MMSVIFWGIIGIMTLLAWACVAYAFRQTKPWWLLGFPILTLGLYLWLGDSRQLQQYWVWQRQNIEVQRQVAALKNPQELIERMRAHLREAPDSAQGWYLLGKLYLDQRQYRDAEAALTRAHQLIPQSGETIVALAKADFFNHQQHLTPSMEKLLVSVLESLPEPVDALNLLAVNADRRKDFHHAVAYWQRALALVPPDSPDSRALLEMIGQAQQQEK